MATYVSISLSLMNGPHVFSRFQSWGNLSTYSTRKSHRNCPKEVPQHVVFGKFLFLDFVISPDKPSGPFKTYLTAALRHSIISIIRAFEIASCHRTGVNYGPSMQRYPQNSCDGPNEKNTNLTYFTTHANGTEQNLLTIQLN
jgi:hypothetical protein